MASIVIRNLDQGLKARLRVRAAQNGRSMEAEVREILRNELNWESRARRTQSPKFEPKYVEVATTNAPEAEEEIAQVAVREPPEFD
jgi:plasmid stability protein